MEQLQQLQRVLLDMLDEIDALCRRHGIAYSLAGGTLLGAVRHRDLIPWDDDVDLMMDRENFDRFVAVAARELPARMFLQAAPYDPQWHYGYAKVRLNGTRYPTAFSAQFPALHDGLFVDIFVQDATADTPAAQKRHIRRICFWHAVVRRCWWRQAEHPAFCDSPLPVRLVSRLVTLRFAEKRQDKANRLYNGRATGFLVDSTGMHPRAGAYPRAWLEELTEGTLGERRFPVPAQADAYLRYLYGDYTRLPPPEEQQASHESQGADLGEYAVDEV